MALWTGGGEAGGEYGEAKKCSPLEIQEGVCERFSFAVSFSCYLPNAIGVQVIGIEHSCVLLFVFDCFC